jgi:hypothetical protein
MTTDSPQSNNEAATAPAGGVSVNDLPPEALTFATRLFNAARTGDCEIFEQVLAYNAGVKDLRNEKGDTLVSLDFSSVTVSMRSITRSRLRTVISTSR